MPWGRLDDSFYDHPKIEALGRNANAGAGVLMRAVSYCNRWLTDGCIPGHVLLRKFGAKPALIAAMVDAELFEKLDENAYKVHDFDDYNDLRSDVEERRQEIHEARVRAGQARARSAPRTAGRFTSTPPAQAPAEAPAGDQQAAGAVVVPAHQHATSPVLLPSYSRPTETPPPPASGGRRAEGTNQRAVGRSPRQAGKNPRANGTSPRQVREAEKTGPTKLGNILAELDGRNASEEFRALLAEQDAKAGRTVAVVVDGQVVEQQADTTWFDGPAEAQP